MTANQIRYFVNVECLTAGEIAGIVGTTKRKVCEFAKRHNIHLIKGLPKGFIKGRDCHKEKRYEF